MPKEHNIGGRFFTASFSSHIIRDRLFSTYAKFSEKIDILYPTIRTCTYVYHEVNVNFSLNFVHVLNEWPLIKYIYCQKNCRKIYFTGHCKWWNCSTSFFCCFWDEAETTAYQECLNSTLIMLRKFPTLVQSS